MTHNAQDPQHITPTGQGASADSARPAYPFADQPTSWYRWGTPPAPANRTNQANQQYLPPYPWNTDGSMSQNETELSCYGNGQSPGGGQPPRGEGPDGSDRKVSRRFWISIIAIAMACGMVGGAVGGLVVAGCLGGHGSGAEIVPHSGHDTMQGLRHDHDRYARQDGQGRQGDDGSQAQSRSRPQKDTSSAPSQGDGQ